MTRAEIQVTAASRSGASNAVLAVKNAGLFANPTRLAAGWYALAASDELGHGSLLAATVGMRQIVLFRDGQGQARVLRDACPHLSARLSLGRVVTREGDVRVKCPFHGWEIASDGCVAGAGEHGTVDRSATTYLAAERFGLVWVCLSGSQWDAVNLPDFEKPSIENGWRVLREKCMNCHPHWVLANGLDQAHFANVHGMVHVAAPGFSLDSQGRPRLELTGYPRQAWLRRLVGASRMPVRAVFTGWGAGSCGLEFVAPIPFRVVFSARPDAAGRALTRVALVLPAGVKRLQAMLLLLVLLHRDRLILEGSRLRSAFCGEVDAGLAAFAALVESAGEADG